MENSKDNPKDQVKEFLTEKDLVASVPNDSIPAVSHPSASGNTDEQAIGFAEWLVKSNYTYVNGEWFDVVSKTPTKYVYTTKDVYEIFKNILK